MAYTREDTLDTLRVRAFDCLIDLGALQNAALASYICYIMGNDPSPFVRRQVQTAFGRGLGMVAVGQLKPQAPTNGAMLGEMIMEDFGVDASGARKDDIAQKETIAGAVAALKKELNDDQVIKTSLWKAVAFVTLPRFRITCGPNILLDHQILGYWNYVICLTYAASCINPRTLFLSS
jgi:transcription initiation factor TFIID subunit 2